MANNLNGSPSPVRSAPSAGPRFDGDGQYILKTQRDQLAATVAALNAIATVPQAYHSRGPEFVAAEMQRIAVDLLRRMGKAEGRHRRGPCPVCQDGDCEVKSERCGKGDR